MNDIPAPLKYQNDWISASDILSRLDSHTQKQLATACTRCTYKKGETIYLQGDDAHFLYFLTDGYVRLGNLTADSSEFTYAFLRSGKAFGELGVFQKSQYVDTASALSPVTVRYIRRDTFFAIAQDNLSICEALWMLVAERFRCYIESTRCLTMNSLSARLAHALLRMVKQVGEPSVLLGRDTVRISAFVTQSDIGRMARCSRSNVNRRLKEWEKSNVINIHDRTVHVVNQRYLEQLRDCQ